MPATGCPLSAAASASADAPPAFAALELAASPAQRWRARARRATCGVRAGDQHEVGTVRADPSPERVRLGMLAIRDAGRRKLERCAFWIRDRHCEQIECAVSGAQLLVARDGSPHRGGCRVVAVEPADDQHRRRVRGAAGNGERVDPRAVACEADVERLGGHHRQSDPRNGDGECSRPPFATVLRGLSIHGGSLDNRAAPITHIGADSASRRVRSLETPLASIRDAASAACA